MKAVEFKEQTTIIAKDQPPYKPLPAFVDKGREGVVVSCYKLSLMDKIRAIFIGRVWVAQMTFHNPLQPQLLSMRKADILFYENGKNNK